MKASEPMVWVLFLCEKEKGEFMKIEQREGRGLRQGKSRVL